MVDKKLLREADYPLTGDERIGVGQKGLPRWTTLQRVAALLGVGPKGDKGDKGDAGVPGPVGDRGEPGPAGAKGAAGVDGKPGLDGAPGAPGAKGDQGEKGAPGPQGTAGPVGPAGPQGAAGPQGVAGAKGDAGTPGAAGAKGDTGPAGAAGPAGAPGARGDAGPAGAAGAKGDKGDPGAAGATGPAGDTRVKFSRRLNTAADGSFAVSYPAGLFAAGVVPVVSCDQEGVTGWSYTVRWEHVINASNVATGIKGEVRRANNTPVISILGALALFTAPGVTAVCVTATEPTP